MAEAKIAEELGKILMDGSLYRGAKPVMWSPVEKTALAEAELNMRIIHRLRFMPVSSKKLRILPLTARQSLFDHNTMDHARQCTVAYGNDISYRIVEVVAPNEGSLCEKDDVLVLADDLADDVIEAIGAGETALWASLMGSEMAGTVTAHPMAGHGYDHDAIIGGASCDH